MQYEAWYIFTFGVCLWLYLIFICVRSRDIANISKSVWGRGSVPIDHKKETACGELNGHVNLKHEFATSWSWPGTCSEPMPRKRLEIQIWIQLSAYGNINHRLNGSSSPVLMATCLSYRRLCDFLTFFPNRPGGHTPRPILTQNGSNDVDSRTHVPFGVKIATF